MRFVIVFLFVLVSCHGVDSNRSSSNTFLGIDDRKEPLKEASFTQYQQYIEEIQSLIENSATRGVQFKITEIIDSRHVLNGWKKTEKISTLSELSSSYIFDENQDYTHKVKKNNFGYTIFSSGRHYYQGGYEDIVDVTIRVILDSKGELGVLEISESAWVNGRYDEYQYTADRIGGK